MSQAHDDSSNDRGGPGQIRAATSPGEQSPPLLTKCADDDRELLAETYRLRYRVYCVERTFLKAADYPSGQETDEFDRFARHFATVDSEGETVGTVRLVSPSILGLPLFHRCSLFPSEEHLLDPRNAVAEISRLAVVRQYRPSVLGNDDVLLSLYRAVYLDARRTRTTHWVIAAETHLVRTLASCGAAFRQIGPEVDYWGPVAPYVLELAVLERLLAARTPSLERFLRGLDATHRPSTDESRE